jgi:hypothetical protein
MSPPVRQIQELNELLSNFGATVEPRLRRGAPGELEDNLRGPFEQFMVGIAGRIGVTVVTHGEALLRHLNTKPDYAIDVDGLLCGHVELKAPGIGVDPQRFTGHNRLQWQKLSALPNLLYSDGNSWALYRKGERVGKIAHTNLDVRTAGAALSPANADLERVLVDFLLFKPQPPNTTEDLAKLVADLCHLMRDEVSEALENEALALQGSPTPFSDLERDWRDLLFPDAPDDVFADYYAQTVTFSLLLAGAEGVDLAQDPGAVARAMSRRHGLLGRALDVLTADAARSSVITSFRTLIRLVLVIDWNRFLTIQPTLPGTGVLAKSPWLYFYETFLTEYDPSLRRNSGAYYTPPQVVSAQVRLIEDVLATHHGKSRLGFADTGVVTLDPAMGTGSYLIQVIEQAASRVANREGLAQVPARIRDIENKLIGFEIMVGPFAVAQMLVGEEIRSRTGQIFTDSVRLYLADTLADPWLEQAQLGAIYEPIARSRREANAVKRDEPILVCIGNPPYDLHDSDATRGGWVVTGSADRPPIWNDVVQGARAAGAAGDLKPIYNLYAYFWRWALWKVFEAHNESTAGVVGFITASSFLMGPGWAGLRSTMRTLADDIWVLDLGGEGHGARQDENVFDIQTPVAITIVSRHRAASKRPPGALGQVHYWRIPAETRSEKFRILNDLNSLDDIQWQDAPRGQYLPFVPVRGERWATLPLLTDIMPWHTAGVGQNRNWPRSPSVQALRDRWELLSRSLPAHNSVGPLTNPPDESRESLFKETRDRYMQKTVAPLPGYSVPEPRTIGSPRLGAMLEPIKFGWRTFDRQWIIPDARLLDMPRPPLWRSRSDRQLFLATQHRDAIGAGPTVTFTALLPDLNFFNNRGGTILPLWRDGNCEIANIAPGLLDHLESIFAQAVSPQNFVAYIAAVMAGSNFSSTFWDELAIPGPRLPITTDWSLFRRGIALGEQLIWLHTFGERFDNSELSRPRTIPPGIARVISPLPHNRPASPKWDEDVQVIRLGTGEIGPVAPQVAHYEVSGYPVIQRWLDYRKESPSGRRSSSLDDVMPLNWEADWTSELLEVIWIVERLVAMEPEQQELLSAILASEVINIDQLESERIFPISPEFRSEPPHSVTQQDSLI